MKILKVLSFVILSLLFFSCASTQQIYENNTDSTEFTDSADEVLSFSKGFAPKEVKQYVTAEDIEEDCEYLKFLLSQAYINYQTEVSDFGFDIDKTIEEIKTQTNAKVNKAEKAVDVREFRTCISQILRKNLHVIDGHFMVFGEKIGSYNLFPNYTMYTTGLYFEKTDDNFYVVKSSLENVEKGMKYTGNPGNLFEWYSDTDKEVYRYCIFSDKKLNSAVVSIDNQNYPVKFPVKVPDFDEDLCCDFLVEEFNNYIYVKIPTFDFYALDEADEELSAVFNNMISQLKSMNPDKDVVVDLRDNTGGQASNPICLLSAILFKDNPEVENQFGNYEMSTLYYSFLDSSVTRNAEKIATESNPEYEKLKADVVCMHENIGTKPDLSENLLFTGNIYYLINDYTASASEFMINITYDYLSEDRITVVGIPSMGLLEYGGCFEYYLPTSGIALVLSRNKLLMNEKMNYQGDTKGIFPDILADDEEIEEILKISAR